MRLFLKSIIAFMVVALAASCNNEPPQNVEPPVDDTKPFAFENKSIKHRELSLSIIPEDKELEYVVLFAEKKHFVGTRELDAIVASVAMQVPATYQLVNYLTNSGNVISASAHITLSKKGQLLEGITIGDGPIDAAFMAIEQIVGHHYDLDDFQIQSVTQGHEAMGTALVRLRNGGKICSGNGISTDIIGASIRAYLNALNKIVYEEATE